MVARELLLLLTAGLADLVFCGAFTAGLCDLRLVLFAGEELARVLLGAGLTLRLFDDALPALFELLLVLRRALVFCMVLLVLCLAELFWLDLVALDLLLLLFVFNELVL